MAAIAILVAALAFLTLYPLMMLFYGSIHSTPPGVPGSFDLNGYRQILSADNFSIITNTFGISLAQAALSLIVAAILAFIVARTDVALRTQLEVLITLPFFFPSILTAMAWGMLGNPQVGTINQIWRSLTGATSPLVNMYSYGGIVFHMVQHGTPFIFLLVVEAFRSIDPAFEEASRMSGATPAATIRRITATLLLPTLSSAFLLAFIRGMEAFESALFFGSPAGIKVVTTQVYDSISQSSSPQYQFATALSFAIMGALCAFIFAQWVLLRGRSFQTVTGRGYSPKVIKLGRWRWPAFGICLFFIIVNLVLPVSQLLVGSFFEFTGFYSFESLTLEHYRAVFYNDELRRSMWNTGLLGIVGATVTIGLGGLVAYVTARTNIRGRRLIEGLAWLPWLMPGVVMGVGLLWAYAMLPGPIQIYGTRAALLFAYVALGLPLAVQMMRNAFGQLSSDLEECSRVLGASWWQTLLRILVAISWRSFAVGWILLFFAILRELSASILLYSAGSEVLSVEILKLWTTGFAEQVTVVGLMMVILVVVLRWIQLRLLANTAVNDAF